jgi:hypothetical protein
MTKCNVPVKERKCGFERAFPRCHSYTANCNLDNELDDLYQTLSSEPVEKEETK